jgi:hypothetical protein
MKTPHLILLSSLGLVALTGCTETSSTKSEPSMRSGSAEDEQACLRAIDAQTDGAVQILSSEYSEANTLVMIGVGPEKAPWKCLVNGGVVAETMFAGSEGAL